MTSESSESASGTVNPCHSDSESGRSPGSAAAYGMRKGDRSGASRPTRSERVPSSSGASTKPGCGAVTRVGATPGLVAKAPQTKRAV